MSNRMHKLCKWQSAVGRSTREIHIMPNRMNQTAEKYGVEINVGKIKIVKFTRPINDIYESQFKSRKRNSENNERNFDI